MAKADNEMSQINQDTAAERFPQDIGVRRDQVLNAAWEHVWQLECHSPITPRSGQSLPAHPITSPWSGEGKAPLL